MGTMRFLFYHFFSVTSQRTMQKIILLSALVCCFVALSASGWINPDVNTDLASVSLNNIGNHERFRRSPIPMKKKMNSKEKDSKESKESEESEESEEDDDSNEDEENNYDDTESSEDDYDYDTGSGEFGN